MVMSSPPLWCSVMDVLCLNPNIYHPEGDKSVPVQFSRSVMSGSLQTHKLQHAKLSCPSPSPGVCSYSCPLSWWCHPTISSSVVPFSSRLQFFLASGSFQMSQFFESGGQSIGASASASVLPVNIQGWFPLGMTGLISLMPKGLSRVFANTTVWKHQFFSAQPYIHSFLDSFPIWAVTDYWVQFLVLYSSVQLLSHV